MGFTPGENSSNFSYWVQSDYRNGSVWEPQYLSMQIVGPEGDADPNNPAAYHFDHPAINTFDPTSPYFPAYMSQQWVLDNLITPQEEAIQDRCHLVGNSAFTAAPTRRWRSQRRLRAEPSSPVWSTWARSPVRAPDQVLLEQPLHASLAARSSSPPRPARAT